jgi:phenylpropionate dioxygenase-like ring-hydroxylating dioxygenase large terminal subunit
VKELPFLDVSVLVARGMDGEVRAFHNVCSHRGNKLVWSDRPAEESHGLSRQFACKYHGWRFDLDGQVSYVHNAPEFFDLETADLTLTKIHCEVWAGFVFINLAKTPRESLREYLTPPVAALEDFPYEKMTELYQLDAVVHSNWKVYIDAYQELYHVPYVHSKMNNPNVVATGTDKVPFMVPAFFRSGKHHMYSSGGPNANFKVRSSRPLDHVFNSSFYGAIDAPDVGPLGEGINPLRIDNWGLDNWQIFPNFSLQQWGLHWYMTYEHWPIDANTHRFVLSIYFVPPKNASERLAQEHAALSIREFQFQDVGSSEALQRAIRSGAREVYYLNDQEVLVRHLHQQVIDEVEEYKAELAESAGGAK